MNDETVKPEPEIKKPDEIASPLPEEALNEVVGGASSGKHIANPLPEEALNEVVGGASSGKHIKDVTIEIMRAGGSK
jgi:hypothetical protein